MGFCYFKYTRQIQHLVECFKRRPRLIAPGVWRVTTIKPSGTVSRGGRPRSFLSYYIEGIS